MTKHVCAKHIGLRCLVNCFCNFKKNVFNIQDTELARKPISKITVS